MSVSHFFRIRNIMNYYYNLKVSAIMFFETCKIAVNEFYELVPQVKQSIKKSISVESLNTLLVYFILIKLLIPAN